MSRAMKAMLLVHIGVLVMVVSPVWAYWAQDGVVLCTAPGSQAKPKIASDYAGGAIVTWTDYRSGNNDIYIQRVNASGAVQWVANGVAICTAMGDQSSPQIISDGAGGAIVTWYDGRDGNGDIYAQRVNASGAVQWTPDGVALCATSGEQQYPSITTDGAGGAIVAWRDARSYAPGIFAQRVSASGAIQWTTNGTAIWLAAGDFNPPQIVSDHAGGAIIVWERYRNGSYDIYAKRVTDLGTVLWTYDGVGLCTAARDQRHPGITFDGNGGAIVTWTDWRRESGIDIYAQRVDAIGNIMWAADGVPICTAEGSHWGAMIVSDGARGAIIAWDDQRSGSDIDVYAQKVNASGVARWTTDGVAAATGIGSMDSPQITSDDAGGAIVTWQEGSFWTEWNICAARIDDSGAILWDPDGVTICAAPDDQWYPMITSDGASGAIVTWQDYRSGTSWDIYGRKVDPNGFTATDAPTERIELGQNYPNPFNPATTMIYSIPKSCNVTLMIYDVSGRCINCIVDKHQEKGIHRVQWNGEDRGGNSVTSGIYFYRLVAGNQTISRKMMFLK